MKYVREPDYIHIIICLVFAIIAGYFRSDFILGMFIGQAICMISCKIFAKEQPNEPKEN